MLTFVVRHAGASGGKCRSFDRSCIASLRCVRYYKLCILIASLFLLGCAAKGESPAKVRKVILISIDALRADFLSCYNPQMKTSPNIDRIAREGYLFTNATPQGPSTAISHKSILYSVYPFVHKTTKDSVAQETLKSPLEILQSKGFKTAAFVGGGQLSRKFGFSKGFDTYWEAAGSKRRGERYSLKALQAKSNEWLDRNSKENFFLFLHTYAVHCPYTPPEEYAAKFASWYHGNLDPAGKCGDTYYNETQMSTEDVRYIRDLYAASVNYVDDFIGNLVQKLKTLGIYDQTMIIFLADHGESLGERGYIGHNLLNRIQLRIPLILRAPGMAHGKTDDPVESIDVLPTVFEMLGYQHSFPFQGRSLVSVMEGQSHIAADRVLISEQKDKIRVRKQNMVCIFSRKSSQEDELYDLQKDPDETKNLAQQNPAKVKELKLAYFTLVERSKDLSAKFVTASQPELDEETREQLEALGYVGQ